MPTGSRWTDTPKLWLCYLVCAIFDCCRIEWPQWLCNALMAHRFRLELGAEWIR
jgi:hypothetical protein